jgi:hypothetical protein
MLAEQVDELRRNTASTGPELTADGRRADSG